MDTTSIKNKRYNDYPSYIRNKFGERIQKLSVNAGFTCPNRDGTKGMGGCTYCNNQSFNPAYCHTELTVEEQINKGIRFFSTRYKSQKYVAYFQAYTNTYEPLEQLNIKYKQALSHPDVIGLVIGTRPDCISDELLDYFAELTKTHYVAIEYGVESTKEDTLQLINRGHTYQDSVNAIQKTAAKGISVGAHMILGLPKERNQEILEHAKRLSELPLDTLKLHQLQIVRGTIMAKQFDTFPEWFNLYSVVDYIDLVIDFLEYVSPRIVMERFISQSPKELLLAPHWGLKNFEFIHKLEKRLIERDTFQGRLHTSST